MDVEANENLHPVEDDSSNGDDALEEALEQLDIIHKTS